MSSPSPVLRRSERRQQRIGHLKKQFRWQTWVLLGLIVMAALLDYVALGMAEQALLSKSMALGASLSWLSQTLFTVIASSTAKRTLSQTTNKSMVRGMYVGQGVKWIVTLIGFAIIFSLVAPILTWATLLGYAVMQLITLVIMAYLNK